MSAKEMNEESPGATQAASIPLASEAAPPPGAEKSTDGEGEAAPVGEEILVSARISQVALVGIFILAVFYTLYFARAVLLPITLALLLNFLLRPVINFLERLHIAPPFGAAIVLFFFIAIAGGTIYGLSKPAAEWVKKAPQVASGIEQKIRNLRKPVEKVTQAAEQVNKLTRPGTGQKPPPTVTVQHSFLDGAAMGGALLSGTQSFLGAIVVVFILVYFMLASGDFFLRKLIRVLPTLSDKKRALTIATEVEQQISRYILTVTIINACLGLAIGTGLYFVGMPNPFFWGAVAAALNFIPYLGATVGIVLTGVVALLTFDTVGHALLAPATYLVVAVIEGNFVTPWVMGRRFTLNPVVIFIWLVFWGWLWGIPGALIAVPMLAAMKIFCDHLEPLATLGEFLGD